MQQMYAEDAVLDVSAVFTDVGPMRGHDDMLGYWLELRETWAGLRLDPIEVLDVGNGRYVVDLRLSGKGRSSGAEVDQRFAFIYTMRGNKVIRAELLPDLTAAIATAESSARQTA
jgi:ketosteroid isomerase-like protein